MTMTALDWIYFFAHYLSLSLLAIGGVMSTAPEMHRYLVSEKNWLNDNQFSSSIALAQAAPGPNVLFIALIGWNVGINSSPVINSWWQNSLMGILGVFLALIGMMLPSSILTFYLSRWGQRNKHKTVVRAFKQGMTPIVIGLLISTSYILTSGAGDFYVHWGAYLTTAGTILLILKTRIHILYLFGIGSFLGWLGYL